MGAGDGASQPLYLAGAEVRSGGPFIFFFSSPAPLSPPPPPAFSFLRLRLPNSETFSNL